MPLLGCYYICRDDSTRCFLIVRSEPLTCTTTIARCKQLWNLKTSEFIIDVGRLYRVFNFIKLYIKGFVEGNLCVLILV